MATLQYITFDSNVGDSGGGLAATGGCQLTISDCYFDSNNAIATGTGRGGAIFSEHSERACAIVQLKYICVYDFFVNVPSSCSDLGAAHQSWT